MSVLLDIVHGRMVYTRRVRHRASLCAVRIRRGAAVLDVGAGDGALAARLLKVRPDLTIRGVDVLARPRAAIPVDLFDGQTLPFGDRSKDVVVCVDVLHHANDAERLLAECAAVALTA